MRLVALFFLLLFSSTSVSAPKANSTVTNSIVTNSTATNITVSDVNEPLKLQSIPFEVQAQDVGVALSFALAKNLLKSVKEVLGVQKAKEWKMKTTQAVAAAAIIRSVADRKKVWDLEQVVNDVWSVTSLGLWVTGKAIPYLWIPSGIYTVYKLPPVRSTVDEQIFGNYLSEARDIFDISEFKNPKIINRPYLICNLYKSQEDLVAGNRPTYWNYITLEDDLADVSLATLPENSYYKPRLQNKPRSYFVVLGRWMKIETGYWDHTVRYATLMDPMNLQMICNAHMLRKGKIKSFEEQNLVVAQVGYSGATASYPIYYYLQTHVKNEDGSILELAKRLSPEQNPTSKIKQAQKLQKESKDYVEDLLASTNNIRNLHAGLMIDKEGKKTWQSDLRGGRWDVMAEIDTGYDLYKAVRRAYSNGQPPTLNDGIGLGLKILSSSESIYKAVSKAERVPVLSYVHHVRALYYLVNGALVVPTFYSGIENEIFGEPLKENTTYSIGEFEDTKLNKSYLACKFFENDKELEKNNPVYWNWAQASALAEATDKIPSQAQAYGKDVLTKGRWILMKGADGKMGYVFATLEDPIRLLSTCYKSLHLDYKAGRLNKQQMDKIGQHILVTVGNSRVTKTYPILFYVPEKHNELDRDHEDFVRLFALDFKKIEEHDHKSNDHKLEKNSLDKITEESSIPQSMSQHMIYFDVSTNGTKISIYKWMRPDLRKLPILKFEKCGDDTCLYNLEADLSLLVKDPIKLAAHIRKTIDFAKERFENAQNREKVPVHFLASGGIHKFPQAEQEVLLKVAKSEFNKEELFDVKELKVIDSKWEGIYSWIAVNQLSGNFESHGQTLGVVELGESDLQVAFATQKPVQDSVELKIGNRTYEVYAHAYEGLGVEDAYKALGASNQKAPCTLPEARQESSSCLSYIDSKMHIQEQVINLEAQDGKFLTFMGVPHLLSKYGFTIPPNGQIFVRELVAFTKKICSNLAGRSEKITKDDESNLACLDLSYVQSLLVGVDGKGGLGFGRQSMQLETPSKKIDQPINWTYGAAFHVIEATE